MNERMKCCEASLTVPSTLLQCPRQGRDRGDRALQLPQCPRPEKACLV